MRVVVSNDGERAETLLQLDAWDLKKPTCVQKQRMKERIAPGDGVEHMFVFSGDWLRASDADGFFVRATLASGEPVDSPRTYFDPEILAFVRTAGTVRW